MGEKSREVSKSDKHRFLSSSRLQQLGHDQGRGWDPESPLHSQRPVPRSVALHAAAGIRKSGQVTSHRGVTEEASPKQAGLGQNRGLI